MKTYALEIGPKGRLHWVWAENPEHEAGFSMDTALVQRLALALERGEWHALLHLGAVELDPALPPSLAFGRAFASHYMQALCAMPHITEAWQTPPPLPLLPPQEVLQNLLQSAPPMVGAEYLQQEVLETWWQHLHLAACVEMAEANNQLGPWLHSKHPSWSLLGRVCFHLVENKNNPDMPFAFMATYAAGLGGQFSGQTSGHVRAQHQPLAKALQDHAGAGNQATLLALLEPIHKASEQCAWLKTLVDSGAIFHPMAWTPQEAHAMLRSLPQLEASGIAVRIPNWWQPRQPPRPQVKLAIGERAAGVGMQALLDFKVSLSLGGEPISAEEWQQLLAAGDGLVPLKGRWVELEKAQLEEVLAHWQAVQKSADDGLSFLEGMRLLAGASGLGKTSEALPSTSTPWFTLEAGEWLKTTLQGLQNPENSQAVDPGPALKAELRPYQRLGLQWLHGLNRLGLGGCLADDMGLGKTVQVIALLLVVTAMPTAGPRPPHLLVLPASLLGNWETELKRFAPSLRVWVAHPSAHMGKAAAVQAGLCAHALAHCDVVLCSYGGLVRWPELLALPWDTVVLDEAQAIKTPGSQQTRAAKALKSRVRLALTGTPVENQLGDLWSIFDFICPGLLGSDRDFKAFARRLAGGGNGDARSDASSGNGNHNGNGSNGRSNFAPLRKLVQPYILRRLKTDKRIITDLPDKTELKTYCPLSPVQASLYQNAVNDLAEKLNHVDSPMARRGLVLSFLMRLKQLCNHPSQWLGDGVYKPEDSGKFLRLRELAQTIAARQDKVLVFTQFQEMTAPLAALLQAVFGRPGLVLHGATPVKERKALVAAFQDEDGPPFFVLSIKAGGTGLTLTAATHVIHFDRWWNPAVENQATDRAYRIGQKKNVLVHKFICKGSIEEKIDAMLEEKASLSKNILEGGQEVVLTELSDQALLQLVALDIHAALAETD